MSRELIHSSFVERFSAPTLKPIAPVAADDLKKVEEELSVTFPAAYIAFLTRYGPIYTPRVLDLVAGRVPEQGTSFDVQDFFEPSEVIETHRLYSSGGMEDWLVPIASDCMGNVFGFRREEFHPRPDDRPIFLFDHDYCRIHQEADSFVAWLAGYLKLATK